MGKTRLSRLFAIPPGTTGTQGATTWLLVASGGLVASRGPALGAVGPLADERPPAEARPRPVVLPAATHSRAAGVRHRTERTATASFY